MELERRIQNLEAQLKNANRKLAWLTAELKKEPPFDPEEKGELIRCLDEYSVGLFDVGDYFRDGGQIYQITHKQCTKRGWPKVFLKYRNIFTGGEGEEYYRSE